MFLRSSSKNKEWRKEDEKLFLIVSRFGCDRKKLTDFFQKK
jgi:hypothetical protein